MRKFGVSSLAVASLIVIACGEDPGSSPGGTGGAVVGTGGGTPTGTGGSLGQGGSTVPGSGGFAFTSGGSSPTGGSSTATSGGQGSGGLTGMGGANASGGFTAKGGANGSGGANASGGFTAKGGATGTGGAMSKGGNGSGGASSGGKTGTGGSSSGGKSGMGGSSSGGSSSGGKTGTGGSTSNGCTSIGSTTTLNETRIIGSEGFDGKCQRFIAGSALGDGTQEEGQKPMFRVNNGGTLSNIVLGGPAADGIHTYGSVTLRNITWQDIGEDALTIKESGTVVLDGGSATNGEDKMFQVNAASTFRISNFKGSNAGKFIRQNGGTDFKVAVFIDRCDISNMDEAIFRTDSGSSTVSMTNTRYSNIGDSLFIGVAAGNITQSNNTEY
jgi:hypothetical protein